jgi:predicted porin
MKKSLLALAVLGAFAGAASAQSSVTIYGLLDLAVTKGNGGTSPNAGANGSFATDNTARAYKVKQSAGSRLGFRGSEDIGGGWSGQFQIEHRFTPDDGLPAATFWQGRSYVQITNAAIGSLYMGREYTPAFWPAVKVDPFGWDGVGQINGSQWALFRTNPGAGVRTPNTVGFKSRSFGGLTVQGAVGLGEGHAVSGRDVGFNVEYAGGPIYAGLGFEKITDGPAAFDGDQVINFGFAYDLGFIKPMFHVGSAKTGLLPNKIKSRDIMLGLTAPIGPGKLKVAVDRLDGDTSAGNTSLTNSQRTKFGIGYDYPLSKRTNVYADFGQGKSQFAGATVNRAAAVGMKHTF